MANGELEDVIVELHMGHPTILGSLTLDDDVRTGQILDLLGDVLYANNWTDSTLERYDVSDPANPSLIGATSASMKNIALHSMAIDATGQFLYDANGGSLVSVWDISTPSTPSFVGNVAVQAGGGRATLHRDGNRLLYWAASAQKFQEIDITTPGTPSVAATINATSVSSTTSEGFITPNSNYIFYVGDGKFAIIDISSVGSPAEVAAIDLPTVGAGGPQIQPGSMFFTSDENFFFTLARYTDAETGYQRFFWLRYDDGGASDWEAAAVDSHDAAGGVIVDTRIVTDTLVFPVTVADHPELSGVMTDDTGYVYAFLRQDDATSNGRLASFQKFAGNEQFIPRPAGSLPIENLAAINGFSITPQGVLVGIGIGAGVLTKTLVTLQRPAGWVAISDYLISDAGVEVRHGISGHSPSDRIAETGTLTLQLDNSELNASSTLGLFSPDHANAMEGFHLGRDIRLKVTYSATDYTLFEGYITNILPLPGTSYERRTIVTCVDCLDALAEGTIKGVEVKTDITEPDFVRLIMHNFQKTPSLGFTVFSSSDTFPYVLDQSRDDETPLVSEFQKAANSSRSFLVMRYGPAAGASFLHYISRQDMSTVSSYNTSQVTFGDNDLSDLVPALDLDSLYNRVRAIVRPRTSDASTVVLYTLRDTLSIAPGEVLTFNAPYSDPTQEGERAGGFDMIAPVATTDYLGNTAEGGGGGDITADLDVRAIFGANSAEVRITNNGLAGFITHFQLRGKGLYAYEDVSVTKTDHRSRVQYGPHDFTYSMPYHKDRVIAEGAATFILSTYSEPRTYVRSISFHGTGDDTRMTHALNRGLLHRITIGETVTGVSGEYHISNSTIRVIGPRHLSVTWGLVPADTSSGWLLGVAGSSELSETTVLGSAFSN